MSTIWSEASLSNIAQIIRGVTYKGSDALNHPKDGFIGVLRATNIQSGKLILDDLVYVPIKEVSDAQLIKRGDIVVAMSSGSKAIVGKAAIAIEDINAGFGAFCGVLRPSRLINYHYVGFFTESLDYRNKVSELSAGANINNLKPAHFSVIKLPIPPLPEQKVIAEKLDSLLAQVKSTKARLESIPGILKQFRQSVLAAAVSGELTEDWRKNNKCVAAEELLSELQKERKVILDGESKIGNKETKGLIGKIKKHLPKLPNAHIPENWVWTSFMDSMEKVVDCHNKTAPYVENGIPLIRTTDIKNGLISLSNTKFVNQETYDFWSRRCPPEPGDIIFTREAPMGEAGIVPDEVKLCMGQRMMLLRPMSSFIEAKYVLLNILSLSFQKRMNEQAIGTGVKHLRVADVESLAYPLAPKREQEEIVRRVEELFGFADKVAAQVKTAMESVNHLTQSILAQAFSGELTKDWREQNPDLISGENSAAALLERIKAEREKLKVTGKRV